MNNSSILLKTKKEILCLKNSAENPDVNDCKKSFKIGVISLSIPFARSILPLHALHR